MGQTKDTINSALTIDDTLLSRMLAVAETVPADVISVLGAAKAVGRDRWEELKKLLTHTGGRDLAKEIGASEELRSKAAAQRFNYLVERLKSDRKSQRKPSRRKAEAVSWMPEDGLIAAESKTRGNHFTLALRAKGTDAKAFGSYLSENLPRLYEDFRRHNHSTKNGD